MFGIVEKHQKVVKAIMIVLVLTFIVWGIGGYLGMLGDDGYIAKVGAVKIYQRDIDQASRNNTQAPSDKMQILFDLINRQLILNAAAANKLTATTAQLQDQISQIPAFQESGLFSVKRYEQFLHANLLTADSFQSKMAQQIVLNEFSQFFLQSFFDSQLFNQKFIQLLSKERSVTSYTIDSKQFNTNIDVTNAEINDYYNKKQQVFTKPERVKIQYIEINEPLVAKNLHIAESAINAYINTHPAELASYHSLQTKHDFALDKLKQQQAPLILQNTISELTDLVYNHPQSLAPAAQKLGLTVESPSQWLMHQDSASSGFNSAKVQKVIFNDNVLNKRYNSEVVDIGNNTYRVFRVVDYQKATTPTMTEVMPQIVQILKQNKAKLLVASAGQKYITQLNQGKTLAAVTFTHLTKVNLLAEDPNILPQTVQQIFSVNVKRLPVYIGSINQDGQFVIYKILSETYNQQLLEQNKNLLHQLEQNNSLLQFVAYLHYLANQDGVKYKTERL